MSSQDQAHVDYYALLNIPKSASRDEIKAAYSQLARILHPDKVRLGSSELEHAQELFIEIDHAYKVLSSDKHRAIYDTLGHEGIEAMKVLFKKDDDSYFLRADSPGDWECLNPRQLAVWDERGESIRSQMLLKREIDAIGRFNIRGAIQVNVDAIGVVGRAFEPYTEYDYYAPPDLAFSPPVVKGFLMQQAMDIKISSKDTISVDGQVTTAAGRAAYSTSLGIAHAFSEAFLTECNLSNSTAVPLGVSVKLNQNIDSLSKGTIEFVLRGRRSGLSFQGARKLTNTLTGVLQLGFGVESGFVAQINHSAQYSKKRVRSKREQEALYHKNFYPNDIEETDGDHPSVRHTPLFEDDEQEKERLRSLIQSTGTAMIFLGPGALGLQTWYSKNISSKTRGKIGLKMTTGGLELELTSSRLLSVHSKGNISVAIGFSGVRLVGRYERAGLRYVVPLTLSSGLSFGAALVGCFVPASLNILVMRLLQPYYRRRQARDAHKLATELVEFRKKAKAQMNIMQATAKARLEKNEKENGLIILCARYGQHVHHPCDWRDVVLPESPPEPAHQRPRAPSDWDIEEYLEDDTPEESVQTQADIDENTAYVKHPPNIDVTTQLNFFVKENTLELHGGSTKSQLLGFYNPCYGKPGSTPQLYVRYKLGTWVYEITVDDLTPLHIPSARATLIGNTVAQSRAQY